MNYYGYNENEYNLYRSIRKLYIDVGVIDQNELTKLSNKATHEVLDNIYPTYF